MPLQNLDMIVLHLILGTDQERVSKDLAFKAMLSLLWILQAIILLFLFCIQ